MTGPAPVRRSPIVRLVLALAGAFASASSVAPQAPRSQVFHEEWRWAHFDTADGLPSSHVMHLVETAKRVWVGTSKGVAWSDGFEWHAVGPELGLPRTAVSSLSCDEEGRTWVLSQGTAFRGDLDGFERVVLPEDLGERITAIVQPESGGTMISGDQRLRCDWKPTGHDPRADARHSLPGPTAAARRAR